MDKEALIYELEKEKPISGKKGLSSHLIKKYSISEEVANRIATNILNYQIDTYGNMINNRVGKMTLRDRLRANHRASLRRSARRRRENE